MEAAHLPLRQKLLLVADAYCDAAGIGLGTLSARILGRGSRLHMLRHNETSITIDSYESALDRLSVEWPDGAVWPASVERPDPALAAERLKPTEPEAAS